MVMKLIIINLLFEKMDIINIIEYRYFRIIEATSNYVYLLINDNRNQKEGKRERNLSVIILNFTVRISVYKKQEHL